MLIHVVLERTHAAVGMDPTAAFVVGHLGRHQVMFHHLPPFVSDFLLVVELTDGVAKQLFVLDFVRDALCHEVLAPFNLQLLVIFKRLFHFVSSEDILLLFV